MPPRSASRIAASCLLLCLCATTTATAQIRVLVDASRDGGVWWNQRVPFPEHQGKPLADFLRAQGMEVVELRGPVTITCALLTQFDLVFVTPFGNAAWAPSELSAYHGFVSNGGRLIYLGEHQSLQGTNLLAGTFGLGFSGVTSATTITQFAPHPITNGVTSLPYLVGSFVTSAPAAATMLGFLGGAPVMGITPFGEGRVFFLGETNGIQGLQGVPQRFVMNLVTFMLTGAQRVAGCGPSQQSPGPTTGLRGSASGSTVRLDWLPPTTGGAVTSYVIEVGGAPGDSSLAALDTRSTATSFTAGSVPTGTYFIRVRARNSVGTGLSSNEVVVSVGGTCTTRPQAPTNATAIVISGLVTISWNAPVEPVTEYVVQAGSSSGTRDLADFGTRSASPTLTASAPPGTYFVRILARNPCGVSQPSNEIVVTVP